MLNGWHKQTSSLRIVHRMRVTENVCLSVGHKYCLLFKIDRKTKHHVEALVIAYGEGRNGKSTFWNVIARVLGTYSGNISADMLTVGCRRNAKPELAEAKGKRMLIAAELEEGMRLNTANVKQLCSTDEIYAEKKYKDPFSYPLDLHRKIRYSGICLGIFVNSYFLCGILHGGKC